MSRWYLPDGETLATPEECAEHEKRVAEDTIHGVWISTVYLGLDHNFYADGPPLIYETLTFNGWGEFSDRYPTRQEALEGHARICAQVRKLGWRWRLAWWIDARMVKVLNRFAKAVGGRTY